MKKKTKVNKFHVLHFVENCSPRIKVFKTLKSLNEFVSKFQKKHKTYNDGYWVDYAVTNVIGEIVNYDPYYELDL